MKIKDILNRLDMIAEAEPTFSQDVAARKAALPKLPGAPAAPAASGGPAAPAAAPAASGGPAAPAAAPAASGGAATPKQNAGTAAGYKGSAGAQAIAKASGVADVNKIKPGQQLTLPNGTKYTVKPGDTMDKIAAANKGGAAPEPTATANAGGGGADQNAPGVSSEVDAAQGKPAATNAATLAAAQGKDTAPEDSVDAGQKNAVDASNASNAEAVAKMRALQASGENQTVQGEQPPADPTKPANPMAGDKPPQTSDEIARLQQLGGIPQGQVANPFAPTSGSPMAGVSRPAGGYGQFAGQAAQPEAPAAGPAAANPSAGAAPVKTGTGGTLTTRDGKPVTTRSDNEIWWSQQPGNMGKQYPGDAVAQQQYDARQAAGKQNMDALKGVGNKIANFFGGGKKPNDQGQAQQPNRLNDPNSLTRSIAPNPAPAVTMENEELSRIINLIHHR